MSFSYFLDDGSHGWNSRSCQEYRVDEDKLVEQTDKARALRTQKPSPAAPSGLRMQTSAEACFQGLLGGIKERICLDLSEASEITSFNICQQIEKLIGSGPILCKPLTVCFWVPCWRNYSWLLER